MSGVEVVERLFESDIETLVNVISAFGKLFSDTKDLLPAFIRQRSDFFEHLAYGGAVHIVEDLLHKQIIVRG